MLRFSYVQVYWQKLDCINYVLYTRYIAIYELFIFRFTLILSSKHAKELTAVETPVRRSERFGSANNSSNKFLFPPVFLLVEFIVNNVQDVMNILVYYWQKMENKQSDWQLSISYHYFIVRIKLSISYQVNLDFMNRVAKHLRMVTVTALLRKHLIYLS